MGKFIFGEIDKLDTDGSLSKNLIFSCTKSSQVSKGKLINILKIVQLFFKGPSLTNHLTCSDFCQNNALGFHLLRKPDPSSELRTSFVTETTVFENHIIGLNFITFHIKKTMKLNHLKTNL